MIDEELTSAAAPDDAVELEAVPTAMGESERMRVVRVERFTPSVPLSASESDPYCRRFSTLYVDEDRTRTGGHGTVFHAVNAWGDEFACKVAHESEGSHAGPSLSREYAAMRVLSGGKGFPRVYGSGWVEGCEAVVMDWVDGITLARLSTDLAVDEGRRLSPLAAARIGRDLFGMLSQMETSEGHVVHGDLSTSNVMVSEASRPLSDQVNDGAFDLAAVDFGSSRIVGAAPTGHGFGAPERDGVGSSSCGATPLFAAPELLARANAQPTPSSDVYAAASVMYTLLAGVPPFCSDEADSTSEVDMRDIKRKGPNASVACAHEQSGDIAALLSREPEVAVAVGHAVSDAGIRPDADVIRSALVEVDSQLGDVVASCLDPDPSKRPTAAEAHGALEEFCANYAGNVSKAMRGEELEPCVKGVVKGGTAGWSPKARSLVRSIGSLSSAAVWAAAVVCTGFFADNTYASFGVGGISFAGFLDGWAIAGLVAAPAIAGYVVRFNGLHTFAGFARGSAALLACAAMAAAFIAMWDVDASVRALLLASVLLSTAAAWCPMVLAYALPSSSRGRQRGLPAGKEPAPSDCGKDVRLAAGAAKELDVAANAMAVEDESEAR